MSDASHEEQNLAAVLKRLEAQLALVVHELEALKKIVGWSGHDERGDLIGEGLAGDLCRHCAKVDARFARDDMFVNTWRARLIGASVTVSLFVAVLWWVLGRRLEDLLVK